MQGFNGDTVTFPLTLPNYKPSPLLNVSRLAVVRSQILKHAYWFTSSPSALLEI